jgi:hypothetical protein
VRVSGGRVYFSLTWPQAAIAGVVLLVLLVTAHQVGARGARGDTPSQASQQLNELLGGPAAPSAAPPAAATVGEALEKALPGGTGFTPRPTGGAPPPRGDAGAARSAEAQPREAAAREADTPPEPAAFEFRPGFGYVVVQHTSSSATGRQAAENIRAFLAGRGVECVVRRGAGDLMVVVTEPFQTKQADKAGAGRERKRAEQLLDRIRKLGQEYNSVGQYSFDKCYLRQG